jgi:leucyl-tRNA synthetase
VEHPISGQQIPVWVGNYVLINYGDGAVMGVPAHDERDFAFAKKYGLPIKQVVEVGGERFATAHWQDWYADKQRGTTVHSAPFDGLTHKEAVCVVAQALVEKGLGERKTTWRLRDWGISRQRYWGTRCGARARERLASRITPRCGARWFWQPVEKTRGISQRAMPYMRPTCPA